MQAEDSVEIPDETPKWTTLVRQYLAFQTHPDAEDIWKQAIDRVDDAETVALLSLCKTYFENMERYTTPLRPAAMRVFRRYFDVGQRDEAVTIALMETNVQAMLVEIYTQFETTEENQQQLLDVGIEACNVARQLSANVGDLACQALYSAVAAVGYHKKKKLAAARRGYEESLKIRRQLASVNLRAYLADIARTLNSLGHVLREMQELDEAQNAYLEALGYYRELAVVNREVYLPKVAKTLVNLGNILHDRQDMIAAMVAYEESLKIRSELAAEKWED